MKESIRAGIVPIYEVDGNVFVRLMVPSDPEYGGSDPQLAKGMIDEGMDSLQTAIKEGHEEVGLKEENCEDIKLLGQYLDIDVYYTYVQDKDDFDEPHYETGWAGWIEITDPSAFELIRDIHKPIFLDLIKIINKT